ncbi:anti-sigma factor antagonist [Rossellomorea marisflavi]|uniref:anti-sigma factor antagonist n=1 Tax=Rossellomorea marisflavi TaxID=189381 RepID=UPI00296FFF7D|nr:anti-sigma factor antagonist [Rossellomorea marisflavi]MDW4528998.1 anti-sigma factor antagonist [Rossellomorea marisflavi]
MNLSIDMKEMDNDIHVKVSGEIDAYTAPKLKESLQPVAEKENCQLIVDLSDVSYMDSTGLGVFVGLFKTVKAGGGELHLVGLSDRLKRLFDITGLGDIMNIDSKVKGGVE